MSRAYPDVITRFLRQDERLIQSEETEMPFVIEAEQQKDLQFLHAFLNQNAKQIRSDIAKYGAVLLRGFAIQTDKDFEDTVLSIKGMRGISEAFMSEFGRVHVDDLKYVLHTNAAYKTGGTLYLGGFHSENYYSTDVPSYLCFCCHKPSTIGGETGLVNTEKVYEHLNPALKEKLEQQPFFVEKWLMSDVENRYHIPLEKIEKICQHFQLPITEIAGKKFIEMYKPSVFHHPETHKEALQINYFELITLNDALRKIFSNDYKGREWFWHRVVWRLPKVVFTGLETIYLFFASLFYSPKQSWQTLLSKIKSYKASKKKVDDQNFVKVGSCFTESDIKSLAQLMRRFYCSCIWQPGDVLLVDNRKVAHAGMPGKGDRLVRAMICNPLEMSYSPFASGVSDCQFRQSQTVGYYMAKGKLTTETQKEKELIES